MTSPKSYDGSCFCGAVQFTVTGEPVSMGYCHCNSCRHWSAAPVNAFTLWQPENVKITGEKTILAPLPRRRKAIVSGARRAAASVFTEHPELGLTDVYAAVIPDVPFIPGLHVNYSEAKLPIRDGLLKLKDFPHGFGGQGLPMAE